MNSVINYKIRQYKKIITQKPIFYLAIVFSSLLVISFLWVDRSNDSNLNISEDECTIPQHKNKCEYVKTHCSEIEGLFNYLQFIYCTMNKYTLIATLIMILWIIWLFLLFGTSASSFFSPNLTVIANYLHLPESVAGVTLAALGNGAPDVFSTFSSFKVNSGGLAIGELIGASLFVTILVVGSISLVSPLKVSKKPFLCDMLFFIGAVVCVLVLLIKGYISATDSVIMLGYYILYVVFVVLINWRKHVKQSRIENYHSLGFHFPRCEFESDSEEVYRESDLDLNSDYSESTLDSLDSSLSSSLNENKDTPNLDKPLIIPNSKESFNNEVILSPSLFNTVNKTVKDEPYSEEESDNEDDENTPLLNSSNNETNQYLSSHVNINNYFEDNRSNSESHPTSPTTNTNTSKRNSKTFKEKIIHTLFPYFEDWSHQSLLDKCINVFCMPFNLVLTLTIPVITPELHKAYKQQVKMAKESTENTMHQKRRHLRHHRHHRHYSNKKTNPTNPQENYLLGDKEHERFEKLKKQQLSRIVSESKSRKNSSLSRSTSFEEIDSLVREGMMKKQQKLIQSKLSKSFTHDNLYKIEHPDSDPQPHPLKKSQSLNLLMMKKKYKNNSIHNPEDNLYQKALFNNSQKQKEKEGEYSHGAGIPRSSSANKILPLSSLTTLSPPKFEDASKEPLPSHGGGVIFKEFTQDDSNHSSPTHDSIPDDHPSGYPMNLSTHPNLFTSSSIHANANANANPNSDTIPSSSIYPSTSFSSEYAVEMNHLMNPSYDPSSTVDGPGQASTSATTSPVKNTSISRVMSVSSINNYDFKDINEYNSYFMETNHISMSSLHSVDGSYYDLQSLYDHSLSPSPSYSEFPPTEPLLNQENKTKGYGNDISTTNDELTFHIEGPIILSEVWNKWLIVIPTTICPLFITLILSIDLEIEYYHWVISCIISFVAFVFTSIFIKSDQIPSYYCIFSVIGFISGIFWIYVIANEVVAVLQSLGKILRISDAIMGLSLFAMGNSLGDLITNVSIARMGFSKMALGACLGTPLLNIILGLGISGMILTEKKHKPLPIKIDSNALYFSVIGLLISAIGTLFYVYFNNFKMTRSYGLCAIIIYALIVIIQVIIEISYKN